ncbi:MAG: SH3 domain-containing protein [Clostridia bacterium]|nr:SH3 domain-containing protein [Clostridia bacterium]
MKSKRKRMVKRALSFLLCVLLLSSLLPLAVLAEGEARTGKVNADQVNVRTAPGTWNGIVCQLSFGHALNILGEELDSDGDMWYRVSFVQEGTEKTGYIYHPFVTLDTPAPTPEPVTRKGMVNGTDVNVRSGPGTGNPTIGIRVNIGQEVTILGEARDGNNALWYSVTFVKDGTTYNGFIHGDYVTVIPDVAPLPPEENKSFEEQLAAFPENYKAALIAIHEVHPSWNFEAFDTGLDWAAVQELENRSGWSYINDGILSHYSTASHSYDWGTDTYYVREGSNWYQAHPDMVAYYMDPRNFLNENDLFQFELLAFSAAVQTEETLANMLRGTFMEGKTLLNNQGAEISYARAFLDAANAFNVSAFHLITRCIQEVGWGGTDCSHGTYPGLEGYYNFFNIGANGGAYDGMVYAKNNGWDSPYKAILAGGAFIGGDYIARGQNTPYFQKYNVVSTTGVASHQYMTNVAAALSEGRIQRGKYASSGFLETAHVFRIPVYLNMSDSPCAAPAPAGSPNNLLRTLSIEGFELNPLYDWSQTLNQGVNTYTVETAEILSQITVHAEPIGAGASVSGSVGVVPLTAGENRLVITCTAADGTPREYVLRVIQPQKHVYDNACDGECNVCGATRTPADHVYENACDGECNVCGATRTPAEHMYDNACDGECNVCGATRTPAEHMYDNACDGECNVCGATRTPADHVYDNACDGECNVCGATRTPADHVYDNACDGECNVCGATRTPADHVYDNAFDVDCNICGATRSPYAPGDLDEVNGVNSDDAIYLLYSTLLGEGRYPLNQECDFNKDGFVNSDDAIYLLYHTLLGPERYPI